MACPRRAGGRVVDAAAAAQARPACPSAEEEAAIRRGEEPEGWSPARGAQVGRDPEPEPARDTPTSTATRARPAERRGASDRSAKAGFFEVSGWLSRSSG
jgi:hypothetical protein